MPRRAGSLPRAYAVSSGRPWSGVSVDRLPASPAAWLPLWWGARPFVFRGVVRTSPTRSLGAEPEVRNRCDGLTDVLLARSERRCPVFVPVAFVAPPRRAPPRSPIVSRRRPRRRRLQVPRRIPSRDWSRGVANGRQWSRSRAIRRFQRTADRLLFSGRPRSLSQHSIPVGVATDQGVRPWSGPTVICDDWTSALPPSSRRQFPGGGGTSIDATAGTVDASTDADADLFVSKTAPWHTTVPSRR